MGFGSYLSIARRVERKRNEQVFYNDKENKGHEQRSETTFKGAFYEMFSNLKFHLSLNWPQLHL